MRSPDHRERRAARRFDLSLELRYISYGNDLRVSAGVAQTVNMSSSGLLFRGPSKLVRLNWIKAAVSWPALSASGTPLVLLIAGYVARTRGLATGIVIERHDLVAAPVLSDLHRCCESAKDHLVRPVVLVDRALPGFEALSSLLRESLYPVLRADRATIRQILELGFPPVPLILWSAVKPDIELPPHIPVFPSAGQLPEREARCDLPIVVNLDPAMSYHHLRGWLPSLLAKRSACGV